MGVVDDELDEAARLEEEEEATPSPPLARFEAFIVVVEGPGSVARGLCWARLRPLLLQYAEIFAARNHAEPGNAAMGQ